MHDEDCEDSRGRDHRLRSLEDTGWGWGLTVVVSMSIVIVGLIILFLVINGIPTFWEVGALDFFTGMRWRPSADAYGAVPIIAGTLLVTLGAMAIAIPLGLATAIFLSEMASGRVRTALKFVIELLAGIPSVVYGFFGLIVLAGWLADAFDQPSGQTWLCASILLGFMALPTIISVSDDALSAVPRSYREASYAMGATRWQTIRRVVVPASLSGITAAVILGMGRAIGETMAVLMVTGNVASIPDPIYDLFSPVRTITGTLALEMGEVAVNSTHYHALFALAIVLMLMVLVINWSANRVMAHIQRKFNPTKERDPNVRTAESLASLGTSGAFSLSVLVTFFYYRVNKAPMGLTPFDGVDLALFSILLAGALIVARRAIVGTSMAMGARTRAVITIGAMMVVWCAFSIGYNAMAGTVIGWTGLVILGSCVLIATLASVSAPTVIARALRRRGEARGDGLMLRPAPPTVKRGIESLSRTSAVILSMGFAAWVSHSWFSAIYGDLAGILIAGASAAFVLGMARRPRRWTAPLAASLCVVLFSLIVMWAGLFWGLSLSMAVTGVLIVHARLAPRGQQWVAYALVMAAVVTVFAFLMVIMGDIVIKGAPVIDMDFLTEYPRDLGRDGGIYPAIVGTLYLIGLAALVSIPLGVGSGIYLAEYAKDSGFTRFVRMAIDNLNGTPSIVFGLFGYTFLILYLGISPGRSLIAGAVTLGCLVLPIIIRTTEEAIKSVPREIREGSLAMGATKWQTIRRVVLPPASPGMITGIVLSIGRTAGETAPILFTAAVFSLRSAPTSLTEPTMALPFHLYMLATSVPNSTDAQYGTALVLLVIIVAIYSLASYVRYKARRNIGW